MATSPDDGEMLGQEDQRFGSAMTSVGLRVALAASVALIVIGVFAAVLGMGPAVWIIVAGVVMSAGFGLAIRFKPSQGTGYDS
ncbi:hypothetical protein [Streptomyces sp. NPDC046887]|uniref:hypothetical protein n=1 Tax=Streptomyces sp. NPDC046887 TaxID=3155472 RepID=UPI0033E8BFD9